MIAIAGKTLIDFRSPTAYLVRSSKGFAHTIRKTTFESLTEFAQRVACLIGFQVQVCG